MLFSAKTIFNLLQISLNKKKKKKTGNILVANTPQTHSFNYFNKGYFNYFNELVFTATFYLICSFFVWVI